MLDIKELEKIGNDISKWVSIYKNDNNTVKDKLYNRIKNNCWQYTYFFIILKLKEEDIAANYTNYLLDKLNGSIDKFNTNYGNFIYYWNGLIVSGLSNFKSKISKDQHIKELFFDTFTEDNEALSYEADFDLDEDDKKDYTSINLSENDKQRILAFLLTKARDIDENMITNIASLLQYDEKEIRRLIEEVIIRDNLANNSEEEIEREKILRNYYYTRSIGLQRKSEYQLLSERERRVLKKCSNYLKMHNSKIDKLSTISQKTVAEVLNISYSSIRGNIFKAKKLLEKINEKLKENDKHDK